MQPGEWSLTLKWAGGRSGTDYWNLLEHFGHIMVFPAGYSLAGKSDAQNKAASLYSGILTDKGRSGDGYVIGGTTLMGHLGEAGLVGWILEPPAKEYDGTTFVATMRDLLGSTGAGTGTPLREGSAPGITGTGITGAYYNTHVWETKLDALRYVCSVFQAGNDKYIELRVDHDGTFHAGVHTELFGATAAGFVVKRDGGGNPGALELGNTFSQDLNLDGVATRVVVQGQGNGETIMYGSADLSPNPYKDFFGTALKRVLLVNEPETTIDNADARAKNHLNDSAAKFRTVTFDSYEWEYDPDSLIPGNRLYVYDPDDDMFQNLSNPQSYGGGTIYPITMNLVSITRPLTAGMVVAYRNSSGVYTDISSIVVREDHGVSIELGARRKPSARDYDLMKNILMNKVAYNPVVNNGDGTVNPETGETTIPAQMTWRGQPWGYNNRYIENSGVTVADLLVQWNVPLNTDSTVITDGDRYELQYRKATDTNWSTRVIPFGLDEEWFEGWEIGQWSFRIRCVDKTNNAGTWSTTVTLALTDNNPPSQPKAPFLAGNVLAIQVTHDLGIEGDADFTLEKDLDHLNIYADTYSGFTPVKDVWEVFHDGTGGSWRAVINGVTSNTIAYNATAATVKTVLQAMAPVTLVEVTGAGTVDDPYLIRCVNPTSFTSFTMNTGLLTGFTTTYVGQTTGGNLLGTIPVTLSHLTLGISVVAGFDLQNATQHYIKVTAVDKGGLESIPSPEATVTAELISTSYIQDAAITTAKIGDAQITTAKIADLAVGNAQISTLSATKLTTGTIDTGTINIASVLSMATGGVIRTGVAPAAHMLIDTSQITFSNGSADTYLFKSSTTDLSIVGSSIGTIFRVQTGRIRLVTSSLGAAGVTIEPVFIDGLACLALNIERSWEFRQSGTGASTNLRLASTSNKFLEITADSSGTGLRIDPNNSRICDIDDLNTYIEWSPIADQIEMYCGGNSEFLLGTAGFLVPNVYNATTASGANVFVESSGQMRRSTSSERYKENIEVWAGEDSVLRLTPVTFDGMVGEPEIDEESGLPVIDKKSGRKKVVMRTTGETFLGLTAEDVAANFPWGAVYDDEGLPDAINWNAIVAGLIYEVSKLRGEVDTLRRSA